MLQTPFNCIFKSNSNACMVHKRKAPIIGEKYQCQSKVEDLPTPMAHRATPISVSSTPRQHVYEYTEGYW